MQQNRESREFSWDSFFVILKRIQTKIKKYACRKAGENGKKIENVNNL